MITIKTNGADFARQLDDVARQQLPFALANTLSRTAEEAVQREIADLPGKFIVRRNWVAKGFRVKFARKNNLVATISHKDPFMKLQEFGGSKTPNTAKTVAVPLGARKTPQSTTPKSKWPGRLKRSFFIRKGDTIYEFQRIGRKKRVRHKSKGALERDILLEKRGLDPGLALMYVMKASVPIKPKLGLRETIKKTINERFGVNFDGFLKSAIRSARPR